MSRTDEIERRTFLKTAAAGTAAVGLVSAASGWPRLPMPRAEPR